jgi:hypothetical protein
VEVAAEQDCRRRRAHDGRRRGRRWRYRRVADQLRRTSLRHTCKEPDQAACLQCGIEQVPYQHGHRSACSADALRRDGLQDMSDMPDRAT